VNECAWECSSCLVVRHFYFPDLVTITCQNDSNLELIAKFCRCGGLMKEIPYNPEPPRYRLVVVPWTPEETP